MLDLIEFSVYIVCYLFGNYLYFGLHVVLLSLGTVDYFGIQFIKRISSTSKQLYLKGVLEKERSVTIIIFWDDLTEFLPLSLVSLVKF